LGEDAYQWQRRNEQNSALEASKTDQLPIVHTGAGATRWYQKGSAVLDMLLHIVGEKAFDRTIYYYLSKHAYKNVETTDFYHAFQDTLGLTLDWFFDQWVFRGGEPHYQVSYQTKTIADIPHVVIDVAQIHKQSELIGLFRMPIDFEVHYSDGTVSQKTVTISAANEQVLIPNPENKRIAFVLFDPGSYVLKTVTFEKQWDELIQQATKAPHVIDRYDAVVAMKNYSLKKP
jgi:aminopeptidase N